MSGRAIRVVIADDHAIVREGIRSVLEQTEDITVVAEASGGAEALAAVVEHRPDVVILDISMPDQSGLAVARRLQTTMPDTRVLVLSVYDNTEYVLEAVRAGAGGYLLKDSAPGDLRSAIRAVSAGETFFSPVVTERLGTALREEEDRGRDTDRLGRLTSRERDVLLLIAAGRTNKEAAAELGISHRTVESHRENLMKKLSIRTVADLTRFAVKSGLLEG
ncbi:MAG TPA: response regulator transcription factor [Gemmatimonadales bacterium]